MIKKSNLKIWKFKNMEKCDEVEVNQPASQSDNNNTVCWDVIELEILVKFFLLLNADLLAFRSIVMGANFTQSLDHCHLTWSRPANSALTYIVLSFEKFEYLPSDLSDANNKVGFFFKSAYSAILNFTSINLFKPSHQK